jgi:predicted amidohydrolase YtcJ
LNPAGEVGERRRRKAFIAVGRLADLTVLSQDIFKADPDDLPRTRSLLTIVGGRVAYDSKELN